MSCTDPVSTSPPGPPKMASGKPKHGRILKRQMSGQHPWGYCKKNGPATWADNVPAAKGHRQSPIDIQPAHTKYDEALANKPLKYHYNPNNAKNMVNNGHSIQVNYESDDSGLEGGPLANMYEVAQFHFHWGKCDATGSEHRLDGKMFPAEAHIVHWNYDKYSGAGDALPKDDGLSVLGIFIKIGKEHAGLKQLTDHFDEVQYEGDSYELKNGFDPACLLPADTTKYWTYLGSLTTPPCYESVTWIVFKDPIEISEEQIKHFRDLESHKKGETVEKDEFEGHIVENYRPPTDLHGRTVSASFL